MMSTPKGGDMKSSTPSVCDLLNMVRLVLEDLSTQCTATLFDLRDAKTLASRAKSEGLSFMTITLPTFCMDFERSLARRRIDPQLFRGFGKAGAIPRLFQGMLGRLFDRKTGDLLETSSETPIIVRAIRQVCLLAKKIEVPCSPAREEAAIEKFARTERSFDDFLPQGADVSAFSDASTVLWGRLALGFDLESLVPRHGPGAVAERLSPHGRYSLPRWHERLEQVFPISAFGFIAGAGEEAFEGVTFVPETDEQPVRVVTVPKTLKGPRVIGIEPVCMQYTQQAIKAWLYDAIESSEYAGGHVLFRDQSVHRELALSASRTGEYATFDLSDASDRVPWSLVQRMIPSLDLLSAIDACRSRSAQLPDGRVIALRKFASMGSALCFPIEAMYFYTVCVVAILREHDLPATPRAVKFACESVYIYGDDIIVRSCYAATIRDYLHKYNCKVNDAKSFETGKFRESCGMDAYDGTPVTPVYLRRLRPTSRQQASELISWCDAANAFAQGGMTACADYLFEGVQRWIGALPDLRQEEPGLGRVSNFVRRDPALKTRWNPWLHREERRVWFPTAVKCSDMLDCYPGVTWSLLGLIRRAGSAISRLFFGRDAKDEHTHSVLRGAVALQRRWAAVSYDGEIEG